MSRPLPTTCRPSQAQEVFGLSRATLYRWAKAGYITIHKRAGMSFVVVKDVVDYITSEGD